MGQHNLGLELQRLFRCILENRLQLREGLKSILTHEAPYILIVVLEGFNRMPHAPIVNISIPRCLICMLFLISSQITERGGRPVRDALGQLRDDLGQQLMEDRFIIRPQLLPNLRTVILLPAPTCILHIMRPSRINLIIPTPQRDGRMIA
ncbi:hypothetical protein D3C71_1039840 [compost metagenome]